MNSQENNSPAHVVLSAMGYIGAKVRDTLTGHNPVPDMPLEVELLITAWDNVKKNYLDAEDGPTFTETQDVQLEHICAQIDEMMIELTRQFQKKMR